MFPPCDSHVMIDTLPKMQIRKIAPAVIFIFMTMFTLKMFAFNRLDVKRELTLHFTNQNLSDLFEVRDERTTASLSTDRCWLGFRPTMCPGIPMSAIQDDDLYYPIIPTVIKPLYYDGNDRKRDSRTTQSRFWSQWGPVWSKNPLLGIFWQTCLRLNMIKTMNYSI